jgi:hypothetical protein
MFVLGARSERIVIVVLGALMAATRVGHFGLGQIAPDASTAVFFLAGLLIGNPLWLVALIAEALLLDWMAINLGGIEAVCVTTGYGMLIPAFASLWLAARYVRGIDWLNSANVLKLAAACCCGVLGFFVLSNIGYYFGGGFDGSMGAQEYARRVVRYLPGYLTVTLFYGAAGVAFAFAAARLAPRGRLASH